MRLDFDLPIDRKNSDSTKWNYFDADVLPLWTADMDFRVAEPIVAALRARVEHGVFGYARESEALREVIVARLESRYGWRVAPDAIVFQTGVLNGFRKVCQVVAGPADAILVQPPVYPPIATTPAANGSRHQESPLVRGADGRYEIDFDGFEGTITTDTRVFILCNPHNPVGRAFTRQELERLAEICLRRDVLICADEIHCDLLFSGVTHVPIASLSPEIARRSVTVMAPSKTFNIPGLHCSFAIVTDAALRAKIAKPGSADFADVNLMGFVASLAAYRDGQAWLDEALRYLESNRDFLVDFVRREMPGVRVWAPEATYLAWLDCRESGIPGDPFEFFLKRARVGLSGGPAFGTGGAGFVRVNFGCTRATLVAALTRMRDAILHETGPRKPDNLAQCRQ
jgi:cystathionine beta-lyase